MKQICYLILLVLPSVLFAQSTVIEGNIFDYDTGESLVGIGVFINDNNGTITDKNGKFCLILQNIKSKDRLRIGFVNYFEITFINLPADTDTIELKNIPLFYYFPNELDPISIFCRRCDVICKWNRRKRMKDEHKRLEPYYKERNRIIENYGYIFRGKRYLINVDDHTIDLKTN